MPIVTLPTKTHVKKCLVSGFKTKQVLKKVPMLITSTAEPRCTQVHHGSAVSRAALFPFLANESQNHQSARCQNTNLTPKTVTDWLTLFINWKRSSANNCMISSISY